MGEYEILEHTADGAIEVRADDFTDLLKTSARGMFALMVDLKTVEPITSLELTVEGEDELETTLNYLKELLYHSSVNSAFYKEFEIEILEEEPYSLKCFAIGEEIDPEKHYIYGEVKMVTYHDVVFEVNEDGYRMKLLFDM